MSGKRRFRPNSASLFGMMLVNLIVGAILLQTVFLLFGVRSILASPQAMFASLTIVEKWQAFLMMLPSIAIGYALLWYWLILTGRTRGMQWGAACFYGMVLACGSVPMAGLLLGLLDGSPLLGLLLGLVMVLLRPSLLIAMIVFGLSMGTLNGSMAQSWIERNRPH